MPIGKKNPFRDVMREFSKGRLHSGQGGPVVRNPEQAKAIAASIARAKRKSKDGN